jgi:hypothetical protein
MGAIFANTSETFEFVDGIESAISVCAVARVEEEIQRLSYATARP